jgi:hypothetical protein
LFDLAVLESADGSPLRVAGSAPISWRSGPRDLFDLLPGQQLPNRSTR